MFGWDEYQRSELGTMMVEGLGTKDPLLLFSVLETHVQGSILNGLDGLDRVIG